MGSSYIPDRDADLDTWLLNFKSLIAASPSDYGLAVGDSTAITNSYDAWHAAYLAAVNPTTRTHATVQTKNLQKASTVALIRQYSATIRVNKAVSDELKIGLGLHIPDAQPTPIPPPATAPRLSFAGMRPGMQDLRAADETTPDKRARPAGTAGLLLFRAVGTSTASDPSEAQFLGFITRNEFTAEFDPADNGKTATYFARWTNAKGQMGPWSIPLSSPIAA